MPQKKKVESRALVIALQKNKGNQSATAKELGISRTAVQERVRTDPIVKSAWEKFVATLEKTGATDKRAARVIADGMIAKKEHTNMSGRVVRKSPDHKIRLAASEQYLKCKRLIGVDLPPPAPEQHLHFHFEDKKSHDLYSEIMSQVAARRNRESGVPGASPS